MHFSFYLSIFTFKYESKNKTKTESDSLLKHGVATAYILFVEIIDFIHVAEDDLFLALDSRRDVVRWFCHGLHVGLAKTQQQ